MSELRDRRLISLFERPGGRVPIYVNPPELTFYLRDPDGRKKKMTIYNQQTNPVRYEVYMWKCHRKRFHFHKNQPQIIAAGSCADVHICCVNSMDLKRSLDIVFLVIFYDIETGEIIRKRYIAATVLLGVAPKVTAGKTLSQNSENAKQSNIRGARRLPLWRCVGSVPFIVLFLILALFLPDGTEWRRTLRYTYKTVIICLLLLILLLQIYISFM